MKTYSAIILKSPIPEFANLKILLSLLPLVILLLAGPSRRIPLLIIFECLLLDAFFDESVHFDTILKSVLDTFIQLVSYLFLQKQLSLA